MLAGLITFLRYYFVVIGKMTMTTSATLVTTALVRYSYCSAHLLSPRARR